ncbi:hypothetical protein [Sandarakinorhabdus sp. AAP62]|uniref:hypothetical protein n=1 Tax=Sandarakinorhabdus sp. AAP62 TaxID=1248916 RepID=UPI00031A2D4C|nr:hypothetical protein [Sandarakinorhabdus sp. AAP62]
MAGVMRVVIGLIGAFNIAIGLGFLLNPAQLAGQFFLSPLGSQGLATLRADFPGFFITGGTFALIGAVKKDGNALLVPLLLLAIAIIGRGVSLAMDGTAPTAYPPMMIEAVMIAALLLARRSFAR